MVEHLKQSTVAIIEYDEEEGENRISCSGVWLDKDTIITAYHCLGEKFDKKEEDLLGNFVKFATYDDLGDAESVKIQPRLSEIIAAEPKNDLVLLHVAYTGTNIKHEFVKVHQSKVYSGRPVSIVGHPAGIGFTYMHGYISAERNIKGPHKQYMKLYQISAPVIGGVSGGGAYDFETGNLLGICSFSAGRSSSLSFFIHKDTIIQFLYKNNIDQ
jgi:S1-C subfamily serine protease